MDKNCESNDLMDVNSDSDESSSNDEAERIIVERAEELERQISDNKYLYDSHEELVGLYRKLGDLKSMREAYERFHEYFPLTPEIWLAWIEDEKKLAVSENDIKYVLNLFEMATKDYLSVKLWQEYAQYSIGATNTDNARQILERGLNAAGLHCAEGSLLWDTLRVLEFAHLSLLEEASDDWKVQIQKIVDVFKRQLSVPLLHMDSTWAEWEKFYSDIPQDLKISSEPIEWGYKNALKLLETYKPFEEKLKITQDYETLRTIYKDYIKAVNDPSTIVCLYERAVAQSCLDPLIWQHYCLYKMKLGDSSFDVCTRAIRNCPWAQDLWITKLRIMEHLQKPQSDIVKYFEEGIASLGVNLDFWLAYLEYVYRNTDTDNKDKLYKIFDQAIDYLGQQSDIIVKWYARIAAKNGDMSKTRFLWKTFFKQSENKQKAINWLELANLERFYGDSVQLRNLFQRALTNCTDSPQLIADEWIMFEREMGNVNDMLKCVEKCKKIVQIHQTEAEKKRKFNEPDNDKDRKKLKIETHTKEPVKTTRFVHEPIKTRIVKDPTKTVFISNLYPSINEKQLKKTFPNAVNIEIVTDRKGKSRCYGYIQFAMEEEVMTALARDRELLDGRPMFISNCKPDKTERLKSFKYSTEVEANKLFIKNLPLTTTQEDLEDIYKPLGAVEVRLILQKSGQPKGLAYVDFSTDVEAKKAIEQTNNMKINEHNISVAISAPPQKSAISTNTTIPIRHARSRLQVPLVPRVVQVKTETSNGHKGGKSNEDFRKMLMK